MSRFLGELLQKAQKAKSKIDEAKAGLADRTIEAESADGEVKVVASCDKQIVSIRISPELLAKSDAEQLQSLLVEASNRALAAAGAIQKDTANKLMAELGINLPGLF